MYSDWAISTEICYFITRTPPIPSIRPLNDDCMQVHIDDEKRHPVYLLNQPKPLNGRVSEAEFNWPYKTMMHYPHNIRHFNQYTYVHIVGTITELVQRQWAAAHGPTRGTQREWQGIEKVRGCSSKSLLPISKYIVIIIIIIISVVGGLRIGLYNGMEPTKNCRASSKSRAKANKVCSSGQT